MGYDGVAQLIDIEQLVRWAFQTEKATLARGKLLDATARYPQDSTIRCEQVALMGGFIAGSGPGARFVSDTTATDAHVVAERVRDLAMEARHEVLRHARAGTRPDWCPHPHHRFEPREWEADEDGRRVGAVERVPEHLRWRRVKFTCPYTGKQIRAGIPKWTPVIEIDSPRRVARLRYDWSLWWLGLDRLRRELSGTLTQWRLSDHMPPQYPWREDE